MSICRLFLLVAVFWTLATNAAAQTFHIEASREAIVREQPDADAIQLLRIERGTDRLPTAEPSWADHRCACSG